MSSTKVYSVGIGVTTFNRPKTLEKCLDSITRYCDPDKYTIYIHVAVDTDEDRKGVAYRKNECLRVLKDFDYIFLLDDDTYPIKEGWIDFFINSCEEHLLFLNKAIHNKRMVEIALYDGNELKYTKELFSDCGGVFLFMTKSAIEKVGAFDEKFTPYGFEHCDYSRRILGEHGAYPMLKGTDEYLYSEDYSNPNHKSSISDEEKQNHIKNNWDKFFKQEIKNIYLPL
jgi:GT2 family glycosyltransferase